MIAYLIFLCLLTVTSSHVLLQSATGEVGRANFIYWSLNYNGNVIVKLVSLSGDADLYVSERIAKPDYELDKYDLHSASCGVDIVHIPSSFKRPVGIGVYGHPSHENTTYLLEIYSDTDKEGESVEFDNGFTEQSHEQKHTDSKPKMKFSKGFVISSFWALMEIFELFFS